MPQFIFHLLANAHLDPVWLWDWREGLNESLITTRTMLDLMDEDPEFTFIRGEAALYRHIEAYDPPTFARLRRRIREGRWDVVGGTYIQPDTNLPATETLLRHFTLSQRYFVNRFGRTARVAWAADSFGHSAGLPEILAAAGMYGFAFGRPEPQYLPLPKPAFWWEGPGGSRVLAHRTWAGWYGNERDEMPAKLDRYLADAARWGLHNVAVFYGLGDHGGGATRRMLRDIRAWAAAHPEVRVMHSTLHRFFAALRSEVARHGAEWLPVHRGELNFFARGCYVSAARFKFLYRRTEAAVVRAEQVTTAICAAVGSRSTAADQPALLGSAWEAVLFNSFHDILPGSSIERAYDDQNAWLGGALHATQRMELAALNALAARLDTRVREPRGDYPRPVPFLVFNPLPRPYRGLLELEASLDYRPIKAYERRAGELPVEVCGPDGRCRPFQEVATEHTFAPHIAWRKRLVVPVELPPMGWNVMSVGWVEGAARPRVSSALATPRSGVIDNGRLQVRTSKGAHGIQVLWHGAPLFEEPGLSAVTVEDPYGSWGPMTEEPEGINLSRVRHRWHVAALETLEHGPLRAALWVRLRGGNSWLELVLRVSRGRPTVEVTARLLWNERAARLKLVMPAGAEWAEYDVPGGTVRRGAVGEVPGGRWVRVIGPRRAFGFASDGLYGFDLTNGALRASVVRSSRYASEFVAGPKERPWLPATDAGELRFRFLLTLDAERLPAMAEELVHPPLALIVPPHEGTWPRAGSLFSLEPAALQLLAFKPAEHGRGLVLRVLNAANRPVHARCRWFGQSLGLGEVPARRIASWRLKQVGNRWQAMPCDALEMPRRA